MRSSVTIVCCYNDIAQYERLVKSLDGQDMPCELLGIDNRGQRFTSCSSALNSAAERIKTEYVIYSHQDIELPEPDMLRKFVGYLKQTGAHDILGVAGAVENPDRKGKNPEYVLSNVRHGTDLRKAGEGNVTGIQPCDTVDECFFGGRTECFRQAPFDERLCDDWHLYAVERCLYARIRGHQVYVCDLPLLHHSGGTINHSYNRCFYRLAKHYHARGIACIRTVCGSAGTDWLHRSAFYFKRMLLIRMHRY